MMTMVIMVIVANTYIELTVSQECPKPCIDCNIFHPHSNLLR